MDPTDPRRERGEGEARLVSVHADEGNVVVPPLRGKLALYPFAIDVKSTMVDTITVFAICQIMLGWKT